jgi:hypothetical protein
MSQSPSRLVSLFEAAVELAHAEERARFLERIAWSKTGWIIMSATVSPGRLWNRMAADFIGGCLMNL